MVRQDRRDEQQNPLQNETSSVSSSREYPVKKTSAGSLLAPLRVRDFRLLFGGQLISTIGDAFYAVALPWLVLTNGGGAQELGIILSAYGIPPWSPYLPTSPLEGCWR